MTSVGRALVVALAAVGMLLAVVPAAGAVDRHVALLGSDTIGAGDPNPCTTIPCFTVQHAANQAAGGDTIRIGPGEFGRVQVFDKSVHLVGAGSGDPAGANPATDTVLKAPTDAFSVLLAAGGSVSSLRLEGGVGGLRVQMENVSAGTVHSYAVNRVVARVRGQFASAISADNMAGAGRLLKIDVTDSDFADVGAGPTDAEIVRLGLDLSAGPIAATLTRVTITARRYGFSAALATDVTVADSRVHAGSFAVFGPVDVVRSRLSAGEIAFLVNGQGSLVDSVAASVDSNCGMAGEACARPVQVQSGASLEASGATIYGRGPRVARALLLESGGSASLVNSIVRFEHGHPSGFDVGGSLGGLSASHSSISTMQAPGGRLPFPAGDGNVAGDPGMADPAAGDFSLLASSPLIDRGDPAAAIGPTDLAGNPRLADGNCDGIAEPDIGALERVACPSDDALPGGGPPQAVDRRPAGASPGPAIRAFGVTRKAFATRARKGSRTPAGTRFRFRLSEPASVAISIERVLPGRRKGKACLPVTPATRKAPACERLVRLGSISHRGRAGENNVYFSGKLRGKPLPAGRYRATITARGVTGKLSKPGGAYFRVLAP